MFASIVGELALGLALLAAALGLGWYLLLASRRLPPPFVIRNNAAAEVVVVFEVGLLVFALGYVVAALVGVFSA